MEGTRLFVALCLCLLKCSVADASVAPFITPCHAADAACHAVAAQRAVPRLAAGVPALGLAPLDPLQLDRVRADHAGLDMDFRNTLVKGLRNCQVLGLKRQAHKLFLELRCSVTLLGDYTLGGKLLVMPVEGTGKYKIKIRDILVKIELSMGERSAGAQRYWTLTHWKHSADVQTNAEFQFQNLFNGNKQLSDAIHQFANSNWKDIFQEVAPPIVKAIVGRIVDEVRKLFDKVPESDLILD